MRRSDVAELLISRSKEYNKREFIGSDPIQIPHGFSKKEDIEISAFLTADISWGQRATIIKNARKLMALMDHSPHDFITGAGEKDFKPFASFVHRTFNGEDCLAFLHALQRIYRHEGGLEQVIARSFAQDSSKPGSGWHTFKQSFFSGPHLPRSRKHLPDPLQGSAAKRMNMYLRWMVRKDEKGVDFGLWKSLSPASLYIPLDVHTGRVARKLGLLKRKQDDWKSVVELTDRLKRIAPDDPIALDFGLFGLGVFEKF